MPLSSSIVGAVAPAMSHDVDARWTMAYAAALGDALPCYLDTCRPSGVVAHPLFPVCLEWPLVVAAREFGDAETFPLSERMRGVHATHDLVIHRLVRGGERLTTALRVAGVEARRPGAYQVTRLDTVDAAGATVCTTWMGSIFRGVAVVGADRPAQGGPPIAGPISSSSVHAEYQLPVAATAAHVYSECARIWNPIHTDAAVAAAAGLPAIILHGTATLALAVSRIVATEAGGDPHRVRRIAGRFSAMVFMPSTIVVRVLRTDEAPAETVVRFEVLTEGGGVALRDGIVVVGPTVSG